MLINASATLPLRVPIGEPRSYVLDYFRITGLSPSAVPSARVRVVGWISESGVGSDPEGVSDWVNVSSPDPSGTGTWSTTVGESQYGTLPMLGDPFFLVEIERPKEEDCSTYPTVQFCINIKSD